MPKLRGSNSQEPLQLFIPYSWKPYLDNKKKVRGKNRKIFEQLQEVVSQLQVALEKDEFESFEVKEATRDFLILVQGNKK
ncbi:hypothetical protein [Nostoc sp. DedQUE09]|uniref:hypothetical protein n=1 Tax=Nostoc sp. DedQUE09 TaxID=3075394 RepID=UPI002AD4778E|nr:hypothetical protein [Nostoc sp. DedQUE09]MDZ7953558.1 hypothetical protein [Nostoc sp. DedQUE09]